MKRVISLLRVSTKSQTSINNQKDEVDIPDQRKIVDQFIKNQGWTLVKEFVEGGISGFKKRSDDRDALQTIKAMALKGEFDVLVVYMADRVGRIADETPLVISFLNQHNVEVWSVTEGEIKSNTHVDKLITYIRYWQSEGESLKTSIRVSDYHKAAIEEGRFRGGGDKFIPYGYKLIDNGTKNKKGRNILDFVMENDEAEVVKLIYSLSIDKNYGQIKIAKYLNDNKIKNRNGKGWSNSTIQGILKNQIYKGQLHMYSNLYDELILSPVREDLIIIPEERWEKNRKIIEQRTFKKTDEYIRNDKRPKVTHGKLLLNGLAYCGYCGEKLTTMTAYQTWQTKDGQKHKQQYYKYRCGSFYKRNAIKCDGQSTYGVTKIEPIVLEQTKDFILSLQKEDINKKMIKNINVKINKINKEIDNLHKESLNNKKELDVLKNEIAKSLLGESQFSPNILQELIRQKEQIINDCILLINEKNLLIENLIKEKKSIHQLDININHWGEQFDSKDLDSKKAMLATVIDKILVYNDSVEINFKIDLKTKIENDSCRNDSMVRVLR